MASFPRIPQTTCSYSTHELQSQQRLTGSTLQFGFFKADFSQTQTRGEKTLDQETFLGTNRQTPLNWSVPPADNSVQHFDGDGALQADWLQGALEVSWSQGSGWRGGDERSLGSHDTPTRREGELTESCWLFIWNTKEVTCCDVSVWTVLLIKCSPDQMFSWISD